MTEAQRRIFDFIDAFIEVNGWAPTFIEIARGMNFSSANAAQDHVHRMIRNGALFGKGGGRRIVINPAYRIPAMLKAREA